MADLPEPEDVKSPPNEPEPAPEPEPEPEPDEKSSGRSSKKK